jgi:hypothetical protein
VRGLAALLGRLFPRATNPIASLALRPGARVVIRGRVVPRDLIDSPLSGARCVYYRYLLEEWRAASVLPEVLGATGLWFAVDGDEAICEFYVEDASGRALVVPERADVEIDPATRLAVDVPGGQRASEVRLGPGDLVEIRGIAGETVDLLDERRGYRENASRGLVRAADGKRLRIRLVERDGT